MDWLRQRRARADAEGDVYQISGANPLWWFFLSIFLLGLNTASMVLQWVISDRPLNASWWIALISSLLLIPPMFSVSIKRVPREKQ